MEFDYEAALRRQKFTESDVNELRKRVEDMENVPKNLSSKKVRMSIMASSATR
jgi:transcription elongation GreA/GreB family factor